MAEERVQNGGAAGGEWLQRNSVFWTQQDSCTYELRAVEKIYNDLPRFMLGQGVGMEPWP